ncbi:MAG: SUMF1/EgtB/PvdO family nonheme iron enzyme [Bacteroidetes bacterium]|nr:SUMF1/EgtB/PvdO family nonheme iron enzyme [Bacteroidota bacterium]
MGIRRARGPSCGIRVWRARDANRSDLPRPSNHARWRHAPNAFNIYDMHGNADELVEDCYAANYDLAPIDGVAVGSDACRRRVYRGGSSTIRPRCSALRPAARPKAMHALKALASGRAFAR